jgi:acetyltransferase EpsM
MEGNLLYFIDQKMIDLGVCGYCVVQDEQTTGDEDAIFIVTIGDNKTRKKNVEVKNRKYGLAIHPSAIISKRAEIGEGTVVMAGACINTGVVVGKHCIVNTNATIDHNCLLGDYVHVAPSAAMAGDVVVGEGSLIGIGAVVKPGIKIGNWCIIGAGAVVIRDVPDFTIVAGEPAKIIGNNG